MRRWLPCFIPPWLIVGIILAYDISDGGTSWRVVSLLIGPLIAGQAMVSILFFTRQGQSLLNVVVPPSAYRAQAVLTVLIVLALVSGVAMLIDSLN